MTAARVVMPELLDALPPDDPRAIRSRRDLVVVNALMGNARGIAGAFKARGRTRISQGGTKDPGPSRVSSLRIAELGGGSGHLLASVARRWGVPARVEATLVDLKPCIAAEARARAESHGWRIKAVQADVFDWLGEADERYDAIIANLFLHHFEDVKLRRLLQLLARRTRFFVACEPRRSPFALLGSWLLPLLGCNEVTCHDAEVSVRAGFRGGDLSSLWPEGGWTLREGRYGPFTHRFIARQE